MSVRITWLVLAAMVLFSGCRSGKSVIDQQLTYSYACTTFRPVRALDTLEQVRIDTNSLLKDLYDDYDLNLANAFGLIPDLERYHSLKSEIATDGEDVKRLLELFKVSNRLNEGTDLATLEIQSMEDLIDCTILQLGKFKAKVARANLDAENRLNNAANVSGAVATVLTAGILISSNDELLDANVFDWMAVASGVGALYLALKANRVDKKVALRPHNNFVAAIWNNDNSNELFAPSTWYLLNHQVGSDGSTKTIRELIIDDWKESENMLGDEENMEALPILINGEGTYTEAIILLRINLLESLADHLNIISSSVYQFNAKRY